MRTKKGVIISAKMQNTVTVIVHRSVMHPIYKKRFPVSKKFLADTNGLTLTEGNIVLIGECRPISKKKCFKVLEVLEQGIGKGSSLEEELREARGERVERGEQRDKDKGIRTKDKGQRTPSSLVPSP